MNISWPGRITPEGIIHPVFQGIGLKKIKRDITSRLRAAGGPAGVIWNSFNLALLPGAGSTFFSLAATVCR